MITGSPSFMPCDSNDRKLSVAQILASHRKISVPNQYRPTAAPPISPHSPHRKNDTTGQFKFPALSDIAKPNRKDSFYESEVVRSPPMTFHEAIGDVGLGWFDYF